MEDERRIPEPELGKRATSHSGPLELHRPASLFGGPRLLLCFLAVPRSTPIARLVLNYLLRQLTRRPPAYEVESLGALAAFFRTLSPLARQTRALPAFTGVHFSALPRISASSFHRQLFIDILPRLIHTGGQKEVISCLQALPPFVP